MNQLHKAIKDLISQHGGLRAAARTIGVDPSYLSRMLRGQQANPGPKILQKLGIRKQTRYHRGDK